METTAAMKTVRTFSVMEREALATLAAFGGSVTYGFAATRPGMVKALCQLTKRKRNGKVGVAFRNGCYRLAVGL